MGYRTLEISTAAEIHIREGQLIVETMDLSILTQHKVSIITSTKWQQEIEKQNIPC